MAEQLYTRGTDGTYQPVVLHRVIDCDTGTVVRRALVYHRPAVAATVTDPPIPADPLGEAGFPWLVQVRLAGEWRNWMGFISSRFAFRYGEEQHRRDRSRSIRIVGPDGYQLQFGADPDKDPNGKITDLMIPAAAK